MTIINPKTHRPLTFASRLSLDPPRCPPGCQGHAPHHHQGAPARDVPALRGLQVQRPHARLRRRSLPSRKWQKGDCVPTANTAEHYAWCEHAWTPWANGLLSSAGIDYSVKCSANDGFELAKIIGAIEVWGYVLLWAAPQMGAFILTAVMTGAVHFHLTFLKDKPEALVVQFVLLAASIAVMVLSGDAKAKKVKKA